MIIKLGHVESETTWISGIKYVVLKGHIIFQVLSRLGQLGQNVFQYDPFWEIEIRSRHQLSYMERKPDRLVD